MWQQWGVAAAAKAAVAVFTVNGSSSIAPYMVYTHSCNATTADSNISGCNIAVVYSKLLVLVVRRPQQHSINDTFVLAAASEDSDFHWHSSTS
jgi:hypothetical protein